MSDLTSEYLMNYRLRTANLFGDADHGDKFSKWFDKVAPAIAEQASSSREFESAIAGAYVETRKRSGNYAHALLMKWSAKAVDPARNVHNLPQPRPMPLELPKLPPEPVKTFCSLNGSQNCSICNGMPVGNMAMAEALFQKNQAFVKQRVHAELLPFTNGQPYGMVDDLTGQVWHRVAEKIHTYTPEIGFKGGEKTLAWLQSVTRSVVVNHFESEQAKKRKAHIVVVDDPSTIEDPSSSVGYDASVRPSGHGSDDKPDFDRNKAAYKFGLDRGLA